MQICAFERIAMYDIYLYKDVSGDTFDWDLDIEMFHSIKVTDSEDLCKELVNQDIGFIDLKYLDTNNKNNPIIEFFNIIVWGFNNQHFDWLVNKELGKIKFIEIGDMNE